MSLKCLEFAFASSRTLGLFTMYFDKELYQHAAASYGKNVLGKERPMQGILGITKILEDVEISQRNHSPYRYVKRFLEQDFCQIRIDNDSYATEMVIRKFDRFLTARIDIKLQSTTGDLKIYSLSDKSATLEKPSWFQKRGVGYMINSYVGELDFIAKATVDGRVDLSLRSMDIRSAKKRIPYWIDYTKLTINGSVIFDNVTPTWCEEPYNYNIEVKADEEINIQVEWLPHRSDT